MLRLLNKHALLLYFPALQFFSRYATRTACKSQSKQRHGDSTARMHLIRNQERHGPGRFAIFAHEMIAGEACDAQRDYRFACRSMFYNDFMRNNCKSNPSFIEKKKIISSLIRSRMIIIILLYKIKICILYNKFTQIYAQS